MKKSKPWAKWLVIVCLTVGVTTWIVAVMEDKTAGLAQKLR